MLMPQTNCAQDFISPGCQLVNMDIEINSRTA